MRELRLSTSHHDRPAPRTARSTNPISTPRNRRPGSLSNANLQRRDEWLPQASAAPALPPATERRWDDRTKTTNRAGLPNGTRLRRSSTARANACVMCLIWVSRIDVLSLSGPRDTWSASPAREMRAIYGALRPLSPEAWGRGDSPREGRDIARVSSADFCHRTQHSPRTRF